jgi:RNA polymerase sigma factor (sigma-70 family)
MMDNQQLRAQLEQHHVEAFTWALSLGRFDPDDADNVLQTAYVNILSRHSVFSGRSSFRTWLFAVIRKTAAELRRREWLRRLRLVADADIEQPLDQRPRPDQIVHEAERSVLLRKAIALLPRRQCEVLHLVFYHDLSVAEAAAVMEVSIGSARRHYERAKQKLRQNVSAENTL